MRPDRPTPTPVTTLSTGLIRPGFVIFRRACTSFRVLATGRRRAGCSKRRQQSKRRGTRAGSALRVAWKESQTSVRGRLTRLFSGVTLGHQHVAESFPCVGTWQFDVGTAYALVAVGLAGGEEADLADLADQSPEVVNEGVYVVRSSLGDYVGQSGNIDQRLAGYVSSGRFTASEVADAERTLVTGGKTAREVAEQLGIDSRGGVANLLNIRNPIGEARFPLMPQPYARP